MGLFDFITRKRRDWVYAKMLSGGIPVFSQFGTNIYSSDVVQQAIQAIVSEMKKLKPRHVMRRGNDSEPKYDAVQRVLDCPNPLMTTSDFLEKITWLLFLNFNAFVLPVYTGGRLSELYPLNPTEVSFVRDASDTLYVTLQFQSGQTTTIPYDRIIHLRYRYSVNELMGGNEFGQPDNGALLQTLELNNTLLQGVGKALKSSFSINGVVKYNTLLDGEKTEAAIKQLETALRNNESGFLPLDLKGEFVPFNRPIKLVDHDTLEFIDSKILRQYGVPLAILTGDYTTEQLAAFYQKTLEPLIIAYGQAFTRALFTDMERSFGNRIEFYPAELIFMSTSQKLEMVRLLGDTGSIYENEKRVAFGLPPLPELVGVRMMSLNYVDVANAKQYQVGDSTTDTAPKEGGG